MEELVLRLIFYTALYRRHIGLHLALTPVTKITITSQTLETQNESRIQLSDNEQLNT